jgi:hypothetical protein
MYVTKGKIQIANNANAWLKNPNGDNVVASNLNNVNFLFFENSENWVYTRTSHVDFSKRCHDCTKKKIPHFICLTHEPKLSW